MKQRTNFIRYERQSAIARIVLNEQNCAAASCQDILQQLYQLLRELNTNARVRAIIITGLQGRINAEDRQVASINAQQDLAEIFSRRALLQLCIREIRNSAKPNIAAMYGPVLGIDLFFALACDLQLITSTSHFRFTSKASERFHNRDLLAQLLQAKGLNSMPDSLQHGKEMSAEQALKLRLAFALVARRDLNYQSNALARRLCGMPRDTLNHSRKFMAACRKIQQFSAQENILSINSKNIIPNTIFSS